MQQIYDRLVAKINQRSSIGFRHRQSLASSYHIISIWFIYLELQYNASPMTRPATKLLAPLYHNYDCTKIASTGRVLTRNIDTRTKWSSSSSSSHSCCPIRCVYTFCDCALPRFEIWFRHALGLFTGRLRYLWMSRCPQNFPCCDWYIQTCLFSSDGRDCKQSESDNRDTLCHLHGGGYFHKPEDMPKMATSTSCPTSEHST